MFKKWTHPNKYESMGMECDFKPSNIMGENKYTKLKYYQIFYKVRYFDKTFILRIIFNFNLGDLSLVSHNYVSIFLLFWTVRLLNCM